MSDAGTGQGSAHHPLCLHCGARLGRELRQGGVQRPAHPPQSLGLGLWSETEDDAVMIILSDEEKAMERKLNVLEHKSVPIEIGEIYFWFSFLVHCFKYKRLSTYKRPEQITQFFPR